MTLDHGAEYQLRFEDSDRVETVVKTVDIQDFNSTKFVLNSYTACLMSLSYRKILTPSQVILYDIEFFIT